MKAFVLKGLGIECELEMMRALKLTELFSEVSYLNIPKLLAGAENMPAFEKGDSVVIPGGFSYSDHFGAGKLLASKLKEIKFFETLDSKEVNVFGVCNGFQIMCEADCFGEGVSLKSNLPYGFQNRWVKLKSTWGEAALPVRHGEGRLVLKANKLPENTKVCLSYDDESFDNGSFEKIAGLVSRKGSSWRMGMMPHPEIAVSKMDHPDKFGTDFLQENRDRRYAEEGDGITLLKQIFSNKDGAI